jgi:hypothetical protein
VLVVPAQVLGGRSERWRLRDLKAGTVESVVGAPIVELVSEASTDLQPELRRDRDYLT